VIITPRLPQYFKWEGKNFKEIALSTPRIQKRIEKQHKGKSMMILFLHGISNKSVMTKTVLRRFCNGIL